MIESALRNIRMLTRYTAWANARLFDVLASLPEGESTTRRAGSSGSMVSILNHAYVVDLIWKGHLEGKPHGFTTRNTDRLPTLEDLSNAQTLADAWYVEYADLLSKDLHNEIVQFKFVDGGSGAMTRGDMLLHVVNHKTYHRGYVATLLYQAESRPPVMDLPVFLRGYPDSSR